MARRRVNRELANLSVGGDVESDGEPVDERLHQVEVHTEPRETRARGHHQSDYEDEVNQSINSRSWFVGLDGRVSADVDRGRSVNRTDNVRTRSMSRREVTPTGEVELHTKRRAKGNEVITRARREALLKKQANVNKEANDNRVANKPRYLSDQGEGRGLSEVHVNRNLAYDDQNIRVLSNNNLTRYVC